MKKNIAIIILSVLLLIVSGLLVFTVFFNKKNETKLTRVNDEKIIELKYELQSRKKEIEKLKSLPIEERVIIQEAIIEKDTEIINDLTFRLNETNEKLKNRFIVKHGLNIFALAGLDNDLNIDIYIGVTYRRYFLDGRLFVGGGLAVKPYKNIGGAALLEIGFTF
jgi:hypothetical protein